LNSKQQTLTNDLGNLGKKAKIKSPVTIALQNNRNVIFKIMFRWKKMR
jgi:hypothetical protein